MCVWCACDVHAHGHQLVALLYEHEGIFFSPPPAASSRNELCRIISGQSGRGEVEQFLGRRVLAVRVFPHTSSLQCA